VSLISRLHVRDVTPRPSAISQPNVREVPSNRLFLQKCPPYPEIPSAQSRPDVPDIPTLEPKQESITRTNRETPRDIADKPSDSPGILRTPAWRILVRWRTAKSGTGHRGQTAQTTTRRVGEGRGLGISRTKSADEGARPDNEIGALGHPGASAGYNLQPARVLGQLQLKAGKTAGDNFLQIVGEPADVPLDAAEIL